MPDAQTRFDVPRYITGHTLVVDGGTTLSAPERDSGGAGG